MDYFGFLHILPGYIPESFYAYGEVIIRMLTRSNGIPLFRDRDLKASIAYLGDLS